MSRTVKVAISLPRDVFDAAECEREARGESRSEFVRIAIRDFLHRSAERERIERYVRGYSDLPEDESEADEVDAMSAEALSADEPWE